MIPIGWLPRVARLAGADTALPGLLVHLVIAQIVGASYAVFFRRRSFDLASGIGWGVSYGVLWWFLGALTLMPVLLGDAPRWSAADLAAAFPSLIGHVTYGAALGVAFQRLEERVSPWWLTRGQIAANRAASLRDQTLGSAPAMWTLVLFIALTIPPSWPAEARRWPRSRPVHGGGHARTTPTGPGPDDQPSNCLKSTLIGNGCSSSSTRSCVSARW
jgi:hypothetical protein